MDFKNMRPVINKIGKYISKSTFILMKKNTKLSNPKGWGIQIL
jgi:hypothetical protein